MDNSIGDVSMVNDNRTDNFNILKIPTIRIWTADDEFVEMSGLELIEIVKQFAKGEVR